MSKPLCCTSVFYCFCVLCRAVTLEKYLGKGKKILLVLIRQFSCLLCRLHLKDLEKNQVNAGEMTFSTVLLFSPVYTDTTIANCKIHFADFITQCLMKILLNNIIHVCSKHSKTDT